MTDDQRGATLDGREPSSSKLEKIAKAGSRIIRQLPDLEIVALEALHFRNCHPNSLKVFDGLFKASDMGAAIASSAKAIWHNAIAPLASAFKREGWSRSTNQEADIDILFISHCFEPTDLSNESDMYVGDLPQQLQRLGISSKVALIDHSRSSASLKGAHTPPNGKLLLRKFSSLSSEYRITAKLLRAATKLILHRFADQEEVSLARFAARKAFSPASRSALRIGDQVYELVQSHRPKAVMITYEGHGWERVVFKRVRQADEAIKCFAYAHAPLFPMHHAIAASLGHGYDPDAIFVTGAAALGTLSVTCEAANVLKILGSARASEGKPASECRQTSRNCLILPEGLVDETASLLEAAVEAASMLSDVTFTIRMHPGLDKQRFISQRSKFGSLPSNFEWSEGKTLDEDLERSQWAIYRGTSAIIAAPLRGTRPLYYQMPHEKTAIDPLFPLKGFRLVFRNADELVSALNFNDADRCVQHEDYNNAVRFCQTYYEPLQVENLLQLLAGDNSNPSRVRI